ncbi:hypothetical protein [Kineosporia babensis]|uniref:Lipoprotein n=1 Tax=Kineosporia babensis TaxID=499548 RepID=A0A9X1SWG1_9ACTN|nr:hypothetical protein [Kineosporia babensis]MCD5315042.1 hypothetical protein [Kineosporia babensis]
MVGLKMLRTLAASSVAVGLLAGCASSNAETEATSAPAASSTSGASAGAEELPENLADVELRNLADPSASPKSLAEVIVGEGDKPSNEEVRQELIKLREEWNAGLSDLDQSQYQASLEKHLLDSSARFGEDHLDVVSCQLVADVVIGLKSNREAGNDFTTEEAAEGLRWTLDLIVQGATGEKKTTVEQAGVDELMSGECADIRALALEYSGVSNLNDL